MSKFKVNDKLVIVSKSNTSAFNIGDEVIVARVRHYSTTYNCTIYTCINYNSPFSIHQSLVEEDLRYLDKTIRR